MTNDNIIDMKKFIVAFVFVVVSFIASAQGGIVGQGVSHGFGSFSNIDRGNWGYWLTIWRIETEIYVDFNSYDDLDEDLGSYYTDYYKTYAGTSYTQVSKSKFYTGPVGQKIGYIFNDFFSAGIAWEIGGSWSDFYHEHTHWSTIHENWDEYGSNTDVKFGVGAYIKGSYPIRVVGNDYSGFRLYLVPFISAQVTTTEHNFISVGVAVGIPVFGTH